MLQLVSLPHLGLCYNLMWIIALMTFNIRRGLTLAHTFLGEGNELCVISFMRSSCEIILDLNCCLVGVKVNSGAIKQRIQNRRTSRHVKIGPTRCNLVLRWVGIRLGQTGSAQVTCGLPV